MKNLGDFLEREAGHIVIILLLLVLLLTICHPEDLVKELIASLVGALTYAMKGSKSDKSGQPPV